MFVSEGANERYKKMSCPDVVQSEPADVGAFTIPGFCEAYRISRSLAYKEIAAGRLKIKKAGHRTLVSKRAAREWEDLPDEQQSA